MAETDGGGSAGGLGLTGSKLGLSPRMAYRDSSQGGDKIPSTRGSGSFKYINKLLNENKTTQTTRRLKQLTLLIHSFSRVLPAASSGLKVFFCSNLFVVCVFMETVTWFPISN